MLAGFSVYTLFPKHLGVVGLELLNAGIGQGVVEHLLDDLIGHRGDVRTGQGAVRHMDGIAHAGGDDLRLNVRVVQGIPSADSTLMALRPSAVMGIFTTMWAGSSA